jgi:hypothetical protein
LSIRDGIARLFEWGPDEEAPKKERQLVYLTIPIVADLDPTIPLQLRITRLQTELGAALGHQGSVVARINGEEIVVFIDGPSADGMWQLSEPIIRRSAIAPHGFVLRRYGPPGAPEKQTTF